MTEQSALTIETGGGVAVMTMNRPEAMNALSIGLRNEMIDAFARLDADEQVHVVVLTGAGDRAFSAGVDLREMGADETSSTEDNLKRGDLVPAMDAFSKPIIGAINGVAVTGGLEIALACDILLAADHARFADTHARVGLMPTWGLSQKLQRIVGTSRAKEISFTGNFFTAQEALDWGLVNHVETPDALMGKAMSIANDIASCIPETVQGYKGLMDFGYGQTLSAARKYEYDLSMSHNGNVTAADIEARREAVIKRGKEQKKA
ncbi:MAG: enoyl-CoA hydratase [Parvibaculales bacterium]